MAHAHNEGGGRVPTRNEGPLTLETLDVDGALQETAHEARSVLSRRGLLATAGLAVGGAPVAFAMAQGGGLPKGDVEILNYALTLEYLEAAFYDEALDKGELSGRVAELRPGRRPRTSRRTSTRSRACSAPRPSRRPKFDFKGTTGKWTTFLRTAKVLEDTGVAAYQGQAPLIKPTAVLGLGRRDPRRRGPSRGLGARHPRRRRDRQPGAGRVRAPPCP